MIIVTGGAGFIGSQLVYGLNKLGIEDIIVVDSLKDGRKFVNLADKKIADYLDKDDFRKLINNKDKINYKIDTIFHQGACSETTEWDGQFMMENNYTYSKDLLHFAMDNSISFVYASSAAVYGVNTVFTEHKENEKPINVYAYSKLLFDNYVRNIQKPNSQIVGLRYFNVYGMGEFHKGNMASVVFHFNNQIKNSGNLKLFKGIDGYLDGEQTRDFVYVDDIVKVNLWMRDNPKVSGIFNVGTGETKTFNSVAHAVIDWHQTGSIDYIPFPLHLKNSYQNFTEANISSLRNVGYSECFTDTQTGVKNYLDKLNKELK